MTLSLPEEKLRPIGSSLREWHGRGAATRRNLEGTLQNAVRPGRLFLRSIYDLLAGTSHFNWSVWTSSGGTPSNGHGTVWRSSTIRTPARTRPAVGAAEPIGKRCGSRCHEAVTSSERAVSHRAGIPAVGWIVAGVDGAVPVDSHRGRQPAFVNLSCAISCGVFFRQCAVRL